MANPESHVPKEQWASRIGVILAVAGSAVGLGNFLRFPGQAAQNGGGAFLLPYFISLLVLGIPLCWAEWTMGRYGGTRGFNSAPGIYSVIWRNPLAKYFGGLALLIPLVIYMYYVVIEAWCLGYALNYLMGGELTKDVAGDSSAHFQSFFENFIGAGAHGAILDEPAEGSKQTPLLWLVIGTFILNFALIYRGVSKGIESFCKIAMPLMIICALCVLVRVLTLDKDDVLAGLGFMWNPQSDKLLDPATWLAASGQIFFSLSVGFGIVINYASYLKKNDDVVLSGLTASSMNEFFEVCLGGLITLPAAFIFLGVAAGDQGTFGLGFNALPNVFAEMPAGRFFGFLWFLMLFVAAITSSLSMLQPVIAFFEEGFGLKRHASAAVLGLLSAMGSGFVLYFSQGMVALDMFDFWVGSVMIFSLAFIQSILYGWMFGIERGEQEAHRGAHLRIPRFVQYMLKYVVPVYLFVIFVAFCWEKVPSEDVPLSTEVAEAITINPSWSDELAQGTIPAALAEEFKEHELSLPEEPRAVARGDNAWAIRGKASKIPAFVIRKDGSDGLQILTHKAGYAEQIISVPAASWSVLFILVIFAFLLLLVHIAGRRWQAEGRFDGLDSKPSDSA